jgi:hypothetical protein
MKESNVPMYTAVTTISVVLLGAFITLSIVVGKDFVVPALIVAGLVGTVGQRGAVGRAIAERIHQGTVGGGTDPELLEEMDEMRTRIVELEERVDFAERLLAQHRAGDPAGLPPG